MLKIEEQLIKHEGFSSKVYTDSAGNLSIGYGRNIEGKGLTKDEALQLLRNDIAECVVDLCDIFDNFGKLSESRRFALIDMRYNLGPAGFRGFGQMIKAIKNEDYILAAEEMKDSRWYHQVRDRAKTVHDMMLHGGNE